MRSLPTIPVFFCHGGKQLICERANQISWLPDCQPRAVKICTKLESLLDEGMDLSVAGQLQPEQGARDE